MVNMDIADSVAALILNIFLLNFLKNFSNIKTIVMFAKPKTNDD